MEEIAISKFQANCLAVLEKVRRTRTSLDQSLWRTCRRSRTAAGAALVKAFDWSVATDETTA